MNIYLDIFLTFLKVGVVSFGGGLGMISILLDEVVSHGWMTAESFLSLVAVSESTPGPIAINMATFIGSAKGGILGSVLATLGVVIPSFVIILLIVCLLGNFLKYEIVNETLLRIRPVVCALVTATGVLMTSSVLFGFTDITGGLSVSVKSIIVFAVVAVGDAVFMLFKKKTSPIVLIAAGAVLGIIMHFVPI